LKQDTETSDNKAMAALQDKLDEITQNTRKLVQAERLAISEQAIAELFSTGIEDRILPTGAQAPSFTLLDAVSNKTVRSSDLLALGPLVINFFRGRWDPYCVTELEVWRDLYPQVRERGALLVGISPQTLRQSDFTVQQHHIPYPLLQDANSILAEQFGIAYAVSATLQRYYRSILVNIPFINSGRNIMAAPDDSVWKLPLPATFVIGQDGIIRFAQAHADFRVRPEPEDVLAAL
jgi:peroxiredoxin